MIFISDLVGQGQWVICDLQRAFFKLELYRFAFFLARILKFGMCDLSSDPDLPYIQVTLKVKVMTQFCLVYKNDT